MFLEDSLEKLNTLSVIQNKKTLRGKIITVLVKIIRHLKKIIRHLFFRMCRVILPIFKGKNRIKIVEITLPKGYLHFIVLCIIKVYVYHCASTA